MSASQSEARHIPKDGDEEEAMKVTSGKSDEIMPFQMDVMGDIGV